MQRIAVSTLAVAWVVCGCAPTTSSVNLGPLPEPIIATHRPPAPTRAVQPPRPSSLKPTPPRSTRDDETQSWFPPGGIKRGQWRVIVVHHSASPKATPQGMHNYHLKERGWSNGLGYHFVIGNGVNYPDGRIYAGPRWMRQIQGAHCKTGQGRYFGQWRPSGFFNDRGIGICLIGDFEKSWPTPRQLDALRKLTAFLCWETGISPDNIYGHGEVTHKTLCPGRHLNMHTVRNSAGAALARSRTSGSSPSPAGR